MDMSQGTTTAFYMLGYVCLLVAALVAVNLLVTRLTREEREAERTRRRRGQGPKP